MFLHTLTWKLNGVITVEVGGYIKYLKENALLEHLFLKPPKSLLKIGFLAQKRSCITVCYFYVA